MKPALRISCSVLALALVFAIAGPASAAYAPFRSYVTKAVCTNEGGANGFGKIALTVEGHSYGDAGTNYLVFKTLRQERLAGVWTTVEQSVVQSPIYPDDEGLFGHRNFARYPFPSAVHPKTRLMTKIQFWDDRPGGDVRLAVHTYRTEGC